MNRFRTQVANVIGNMWPEYADKTNNPTLDGFMKFLKDFDDSMINPEQTEQCFCPMPSAGVISKTCPFHGDKVA